MKTQIGTPSVGRRGLRSAGFSLLELSIVLGIIAVLVALLLPAAGEARKQARSVGCAANLRQVHDGVVSWTAASRPRKLAALGWMEQVLPHVGTTDVYQCGESDLVLTSLDKAGAWESTPATPSTPAPTTPPPSTRMPPSLDDTYVQITTGGETWNVPVKEGPWFKKSNETANSYDLWLEDAGFQGGGDQDFQDVGLRVTNNGDGSTTIELLKRANGKMSTYNSALMANTPNGPKTLMSNMYKNGAQAGALALVLTPPEPPADSGGDGDGGSDSGQGGKLAFRPGSGAPADYAMNARAEEVFGVAGKLLAVDYAWSVADPDVDNWSQSQWQAGDGRFLVFGRHRGGANVLYGDGSVVLEPVTTTHVNPGFVDNRKTYWEAK